jgi:predicted transcriptional regulator
MTKHSLEILIERIASWPDEAQEEFVKSLADIERRHKGIYRLNDEERAAVRQGLADLKAGRLASDDAVAAVFSRYGA